AVAGAAAHVRLHEDEAFIDEKLRAGAEARQRLRLRAAVEVHDDRTRLGAGFRAADPHRNRRSVPSGIALQLRGSKASGVYFGRAGDLPLDHALSLPIVDVAVARRGAGEDGKGGESTIGRGPGADHAVAGRKVGQLELLIAARVQGVNARV